MKQGEKQKEILGRANAVEKAKDMSDHRPVYVERADGAVEMKFRRGDLTKYHFRTRDRRRRKQRQS